MEVKLSHLLRALNGYLDWAQKYGPPTRTKQPLPPEYDIRRALRNAPDDDPFFDLDAQIQSSLIECLNGYEYVYATPFTQNAYLSLIRGVRTLYVEKAQLRISRDRRRWTSAQ